MNSKVSLFEATSDLIGQRPIWRYLLIPFLSLATMSEAKAEELDEFQTLRAQIVTVGDIDWRLTSAISGACDSGGASIGVIIDSLDAYPADTQDKAARSLGLGTAPQIAHVSLDSPAHSAGLKDGDEIRLLNGQSIEQVVDTIDGVSTAHRVERALSALSPDQPASLEVIRDAAERHVTVVPRKFCRHTAIVAPSDSVKAYSDRSGLAVTTGLLDHVRSRDELALLIGHELAHVILYDFFEAQDIRAKAKEDIADSIGLRMAGCAGFDVASAIEFWKDFDKSRPLSFLPSFSHRKSRVRYEALQKASGDLRCESLAVEIAAMRAA